MPIKHNFVSPVTDDNDPDIVGPDDWNDDHDLSTASVGELSDVDLTGAADGDFLQLDSGVWVPAQAGGGGATELIAETLLSSAAASVTFSSIPATFQHLRLIAMMIDGASTNADVFLRMNGDTGNNYDHMYVQGAGSATSAGATGESGIRIARVASGVLSQSVIDIPRYAGTAVAKPVTALNFNASSSPNIRAVGGIWQSTAAITSLTIFKSGNFAIGSIFSLYGIKGA